MIMKMLDGSKEVLPAERRGETRALATRIKEAVAQSLIAPANSYRP